MDSFYDVSIFFITENGEFIYGEEYDRKLDRPVVFVMMTNATLNQDYRDDNSITISTRYSNGAQGKQVDHLRDISQDDNDWTYIWQADEQEIPNIDYKQNEFACMVGDFDGYGHTRKIMQHTKEMFETHNNDTTCQSCYDKITYDSQMFPAIYAAYLSMVDYRRMKVYGYLPSLGQISFIVANYKSMKRLFYKQTNKSILTEFKKRWFWWTSTQYNSTHVWYLTAEGTSDATDKVDSTYSVLPLYKI